MENSSFLSPPAKRPFTMQDNNITNGGAAKRRSKPPPPPLAIPLGHIGLRLLCHVSKIGGVIGKSGSIVKIFRQETGAKIRIEEPVVDCDERIILIVAPENPKKIITLKGGLNIEDDKESGEDVQVSPAQEAFVRIFERILDVEAETEGIFPPPGGAVSCRLLAATSQIGAVLGKGGKIIEKIRKESGAKVRVMPPDQLPACASVGDEVIQILGDVLAVKKALVDISRCLQDNPPIEKAQVAGGRPVGTALHGTYPEIYGELPHRNSLVQPPLGSAIDYAPRVDYASRSRPLPAEVDRFSMLDPNKQQDVVFRLLCSNDTVGGVIGKGGTIVRSLQDETGAIISVASSVPEADERVITISAKENPESRYSPAQNAVVRVFTRSVEAGIEKGLDAGSNRGASVSVRLLVATKEVGCLMGKGGAIIQEMRKLTGTGIRIIGGDKVPKCASENDQVVQIIGDFRSVQDAVFHVTGRLRENIFPNKTLNGPGPGSSTYPELSPYGRLREPTSPGLYPSMGLSRNIDRKNTLTHGMDHLGLSHSLDRPRSPQLWATQTLGGGNSRGIAEAGRGLTSFRSGSDFGSGGKSAVVTNTTVEILVPEQVLGSVYGDNGSNLTRLRQISGAKVVMHDPRPGTNEAIVIISGTPDQTQAAQSLLQAFILSGQSSPDHRSRSRLY
ncbi:hypothetical protein AQUCO_01000252v1 [Aquilegia coerulea]|uniref:K Homology domain-containing protein n=1 Tax=Aquilegia coerulea TaxID=218851 RepID=A0A2G5E916_AQUCA|nr:hypothetical protein AQUCO_01000252v1 [Aquilegia coerulea]